MKLFSVLSMITLALSGNLAAADCVEINRVDCGSFKVISQTCPVQYRSPDGSKLLNGKIEKLIARFNDVGMRVVGLDANAVDGYSVYTGPLDSKTELYIMKDRVSGPDDFGGPLRNVYTTFTWSGHKQNSDTTTCKEL